MNKRSSRRLASKNTKDNQSVEEELSVGSPASKNPYRTYDSGLSVPLQGKLITALDKHGGLHKAKLSVVVKEANGLFGKNRDGKPDQRLSQVRNKIKIWNRLDPKVYESLRKELLGFHSLLTSPSRVTTPHTPSRPTSASTKSRSAPKTPDRAFAQYREQPSSPSSSSSSDDEEEQESPSPLKSLSFSTPTKHSNRMPRSRNNTYDEDSISESFSGLSIYPRYDRNAVSGEPIPVTLDRFDLNEEFNVCVLRDQEIEAPNGSTVLRDVIEIQIDVDPRDYYDGAGGKYKAEQVNSNLVLITSPSVRPLLHEVDSRNELMEAHTLQDHFKEARKLKHDMILNAVAKDPRRRVKKRLLDFGSMKLEADLMPPKTGSSKELFHFMIPFDDTFTQEDKDGEHQIESLVYQLTWRIPVKPNVDQTIKDKAADEEDGATIGASLTKMRRKNRGGMSMK
jgi:hypothetical protein